MKFIINFFKNLFGTKKQSQEKYEKNETVETKKVEETVVIFSPSVFKIDTLETPVVEVVEEKKEIFVEEIIKEETKQEETTIKLQDVVVLKEEPVAEPQPAEPAIEQKPLVEEVVEVKKESKKETPKQTTKVETKKKDFNKEKSKQQKKQDKVEKSEPSKKSKPKNK